MSALRLIKETEVISGVSSINITDVFSSDFDIYMVDFSNLLSTSSSYYYIRCINSSGSVVSTGNDFATHLIRSNGTEYEYRGTNTVSMWATSNVVVSVSNGNTGNAGVLYFFNPFSSSSYTFMLGQEAYYGYSSSRQNKHIGVHTNTTSMTGINLLNYAETFTGGTIRTYGLRVDS